MPIYEYTCRSCDKAFEALVMRSSDEAEVACPDCKARDVERRISRPAAPPSGTGARVPRACGPVG
jgi:putative FmdB family regulatory protein